MGNVLELLHLENRVVDDLLELQLLCKVVGNQPLRQLVGNDGIQQVELVDPIERFSRRNRVQQISEEYLDSLPATWLMPLVCEPERGRSRCA